MLNGFKPSSYAINKIFSVTSEKNSSTFFVGLKIVKYYMLYTEVTFYKWPFSMRNFTTGSWPLTVLNFRLFKFFRKSPW